MLSNVRSAGAFVRKWVVLFLVLSVFWFGLHARLEALKRPANIADSKMSVERHSAEVLKAVDKQDSPTDDVDALILRCFSRTFHSAVAPPLSELARIELADPRKLDPSGVHSLHGPPPATL
jgi:hypothetical protein